MFNTKSLLLCVCGVMVALMLAGSCASHEFPDYTCGTEAVSFSADIQPIVTAKCALSGCHNGDLGADRNWTNFATFQSKAASGAVKTRVVNRIMPPASSAGGPLSAEEIAAIACWTDQGAPNN